MISSNATLFRRIARRKSTIVSHVPEAIIWSLHMVNVLLNVLIICQKTSYFMCVLCHSSKWTYKSKLFLQLEVKTHLWPHWSCALGFCISPQHKDPSDLIKSYMIWVKKELQPIYVQTRLKNRCKSLNGRPRPPLWLKIYKDL